MIPDRRDEDRKKATKMRETKRKRRIKGGKN